MDITSDKKNCFSPLVQIVHRASLDIKFKAIVISRFNPTWFLIFQTKQFEPFIKIYMYVYVDGYDWTAIVA